MSDLIGKRIALIDTPQELRFAAYSTVVTVRRSNGCFASASVPPLDNLPMDALRSHCPLPPGYEWSRQTAFSAIVVQRKEQ